jgi:hypothetical protein
MSKIVAGVALIAAIIAIPLTAGVSLGIFFSTASLMANLAIAGLSVGASLIVGGIAQALQHQLGTTIATRQAAADQTIVYGRSRVGGTIIYESITHGNEHYNSVVVHASHSCQGVVALYLDGKQVWFANPSGAPVYIPGTSIPLPLSTATSLFSTVSCSPIPVVSYQDDGLQHYDASGNPYNFGGHVYWETRPGTATQATFADLTVDDPNWPATATVAGHCCSYIQLNYDANTFPNGLPGIRVDIVGKNDIFDPRTGLHGYSENPALIAADVLCNSSYGLQCVYANEVNQAQLIASANVCDESIALASSGYEPTYSCNGIISTNLPPGDILRGIVDSMAGRMTCVDGAWNIYAGYFPGVALSLDQTALIAPIKYKFKRKYRDLVNAVKASFVCPTYPYVSAGPGLPFGQKISGIFDGEWHQTDAPDYAQDVQHGYSSDANLAADNNVKLWLDTRFPFTISVATAQRLMKIALLRNRQQGTGVLTCSLAAYQLQPLDVFEFTYPRFGWSNKLFEVQQTRLNITEPKQGEAARIFLEMDVAETDPSVYSWSVTEELPLNDNLPPTLPNMAYCQPPSSITLESDASTVITGADGLQRSQIKVSWVNPTDAFITRGGKIELQYQVTGAASWAPWSQFDGGITQAYLGQVNDGVNYTVQVRAVNTSGAYSVWVQGSITVANTGSIITTSTLQVNGTTVG